MLLQNPLLAAIHLRALELDDLPAFDADKMVVMALMRMLISGDAVVENYFSREPALADQLHGAMYGSVTDIPVLATNHAIEVVN